jgi:DNA uptake protein ComE-like DNA-binding protein
MKKAFKDFFTFEKRGQKGLFVLVIILSLQLIVLWLLNFYNPLQKASPEFILTDVALLDSLEKQENNTYEVQAADAFNDDVVAFHSYKNEGKRFMFNPNTITDEEWISLGLSAKQTKVIRKYLGKGGSFKKPADVLNFKFVKEELWNELIPYIVIDTPNFSKTNSYTFTKDTSAAAVAQKAQEKAERLIEFRKNLNFEFNTCSRFNLKQLNLLDSITIDNIMRYKKGLGGFVNLAQLYEPEGIDTNNFAKLKTHLTLDLMSVKTININNCSVSQLNKHPYISNNIAIALVNYRNAHGKFNQIADLKKCMAMNDNLLKKITPYLRLSDD